jgi:hypothetical protein
MRGFVEHYVHEDVQGVFMRFGIVPPHAYYVYPLRIGRKITEIQLRVMPVPGLYRSFQHPENGFFFGLVLRLAPGGTSQQEANSEAIS